MFKPLFVSCILDLKYFYILATSLKTHYKIISFLKKMEDIWFFILIYFLKNIFFDVDGPFMFTNWWKVTTKTNSVTSLTFILMFSKKLDKVDNDFKY